LKYENGRLHFVFGPNSKLAQIFIKYVQELEDAYYKLLPHSRIQSIYASFKRELDPIGVTEVGKEEFDRIFSDAIPLDDIIENPSLYRGIEAISYILLIRLRDRLISRENSDFTMLDKYKEYMFIDIATYLRERLAQTINALSERTVQLGSTNILNAEQRISGIKEGLEDAIFIIESQNGQAYTHDKRTEPTYGL